MSSQELIRPIAKVETVRPNSGTERTAARIPGGSGEEPSRQAALARLHYRMQTGGFISECRETRDGFHIRSDVTSIPMWNHSAWLSDSVQGFAEFLKAAGAAPRVSERRPVIYCIESALKKELEAALFQAGYEPFDREAWMILDRAAPSRDDAGNEFETIRAGTDSEMEEFIRVFYAAYQISDPAYAQALRAQLKAPEVHHYLGRAQGRTVSIATLIEREGAACIYNVGTLPEARKRGYGGKLMARLLQNSSQRGHQPLFLQVDSASASERLYQRLGFQTAFVRIGYRLRNWRPPEPLHGTQLPVLLSEIWPETELQTRPEGHARLSRHFPAALPGQVAASAQRLGARPETLLISAWAGLLSRYTSEERVSFGLRLQSGPGYPVETSVAAPRDETVSRWIARLDGELFGAGRPAPTEGQTARRHHTVLLLAPPEQSAPELSSAGAPLEWRPDLENGSLQVRYLQRGYSEETIERMIGHYFALLEELACCPEKSMASLRMLSIEERHRLLAEMNPPANVPLADSTLARLFESRVEQSPDAEAIVPASLAEETSPRLTYSQLNARANRLAHALRRLGVAPEVLAGICLERSTDMIVALLAVLKAGGAALPLDSDAPPQRLALILEETEAPAVLTQRRFAALFTNGQAKVLYLDDPSEWESESPENPGPAAGPDNLAYVIYTSGSTGKPKGVLIPHRAIASHCLEVQQHYQFTARDGVLQFSAFNFDAAFEQIFGALLSGARLIIRGPELWTTSELNGLVSRLGISVADIPTAYWSQWVREWAGKPEANPPAPLRLVIVGGETMPVETVRLWFRSPLKDIRLINAYGPTEATITAATCDLVPGPLPSRVPIGRPRGARKIYLLDRLGRLVPMGVPGQLHIAGPLLARGYLKRPEMTAEKFRPDPFSEPGARMYDTGDLARYLPDGRLDFLGRTDDQVKIRGFRIEPGEIEKSLRAHPEVQDAIVVARETAPGEKRLVAYVIPSVQGREIAGSLARFLKQSLPEYMIPSDFIELSALPLLPSGKVDRRALPDPAQVVPPSTVEVKGPREPIELQLKLIFERVLRKCPIGIDTSFFEVGGDSLQALEVLVEIERLTGRNLPLGALYQSSSIQSLAEVLKASSDRAENSLVPLQAHGSKPPFYLIHTTPGDILAYGNLVYHLGPDQPSYGFQSLGLCAPERAHSGIEEMAAYYVDLLRASRPNGPYHLGGWCYGGVVAVEMARILLRQGQEVGLLALLETVAMPPSLANYRYYLRRIRCCLEMSPSRWREYVRAKLQYRRDFRTARMRFRRVGRAGNEEDERTKSRLALLELVYNANLDALANYRSSPYPGRVTLFTAQELDPALIPDSRYGWTGLASEIEIHGVPGNHDRMLSEPHVSVLAEKISRCLRQWTPG